MKTFELRNYYECESIEEKRELVRLCQEKMVPISAYAKSFAVGVDIFTDVNILFYDQAMNISVPIHVSIERKVRYEKLTREQFIEYCNNYMTVTALEML